MPLYRVCIPESLLYLCMYLGIYSIDIYVAYISISLFIFDIFYLVNSIKKKGESKRSRMLTEVEESKGENRRPRSENSPETKSGLVYS